MVRPTRRQAVRSADAGQSQETGQRSQDHAGHERAPGAEGAWVPASKVQGLFAPPAAATTPPAPAAAQAVPRAVPLSAPPLATPLPPPTASGMAPPPWARPAVPKAVPSGQSAMAAKIVGAVAITFGAAAMVTFWLPILGGLLGWTGMIAGALGLVIGIAGLVFAAVSNGSGLILNIAGTSSSAVGLVLAVVLGATYGMFAGAPPPMIVQKPALPDVPPSRQELPPPVEPEPEPEPVWTDASQPIEQAPIKASITGVVIEQIRLESSDISTMKRQPPQPMLKIRLAIENISTDKIVAVPGWVGGGDAISQGVGQLLGGEAGKAVQAATATAKLTDNVGNSYTQTPAHSVFGAKISFGEDPGVRPGDSTQAELIFKPPLETIEFLRLELSAGGFSGTDALRFQIPKAMIGGLSGSAGG